MTSGGGKRICVGQLDVAAMGVMVVLILVMLVIGLFYQNAIPPKDYVNTMLGLGGAVALTITFLVGHIWYFSNKVDTAVNDMVDRKD